MIDLKKIVYSQYNERDIEVPAVLGFLQGKDITSLLDVGAKYSYYTYAQDIRNILPNCLYDGVDPQFCQKTSEIIDNYYQSGVLSLNQMYDCVTCISTLEHVGIAPVVSQDYVAEQLKVFKHCIDLCRTLFFFSFPFGAPGLYEGEYSNITESQLQEMFTYLDGFTTEVRFYYNEFPQGRLLWNEVSLSEASVIPLRKDKGVQCVAFLAGVRNV
jgi:hypothetical protein